MRSFTNPISYTPYDHFDPLSQMTPVRRKNPESSSLHTTIQRKGVSSKNNDHYFSQDSSQDTAVTPPAISTKRPFDTWQGKSKTMRPRLIPTPKPLITYIESQKPTARDLNTLPEDVLSTGQYEDEFEQDLTEGKGEVTLKQTKFFDMPLENPILSQHQIEFCFVGGGPACFSAISSIVRHNQLHEIMEGRGFAIIERTSSFASGNLGEYGIRSNTSINSFLKTIMKLEENAVKTIKISNSKKRINGKSTFSQIYISSNTQKVPSEKQCEALSIYKKLWNSSLVEYMRDPEVRSKIVCLPIIAAFLCCAGNTLLQYIYTIFKKRVFYPFHEVVKIEDLKESRKVRIVAKDIRKNKIKIFIAKAIALGTGAKAQQPPAYIEEAALQNKHKKVYSADQVLRYDGFMELLSCIKHQGPFLKSQYRVVNPFHEPKTPTVPRSESGVHFKRQVVRSLSDEQPKPPQVVIIGGAHSAFSVAWLLLNGAPPEIHNRIRLPARKWIKMCKQCCTCNKKEEKENSCKCQCSCLGGLYDLSDWIVNQETCRSLELPHFQTGSIKIIHRHPIKIYYRSMTEARNDGYLNKTCCTPDTPTKAAAKEEIKSDLLSDKSYKPHKKQHKIYEFSGLRGDAKELYRKIKDGKEDRIQLVQTESEAQVQKIISQSDAVVWAGGYSTNCDISFNSVSRVPDSSQPSKLVTQEEEVQLSCNSKDKRAQVQYGKGKASRVIQKSGKLFDRIYGIGIGFPIRLTEQHSKFFVNADGIGFYVNNIQEKLIKHVLPYKSNFPMMRSNMTMSQPPVIKSKNFQDEAAPTREVKMQSTSFDMGVVPAPPQILSPTKQNLLKKRAVLLEKKYKQTTKPAQIQSDVEKQVLTRRSQGVVDGSRPASRNSTNLNRKKSLLKNSKTPKLMKSPGKVKTVLEFDPENHKILASSKPEPELKSLNPPLKDGGAASQTVDKRTSKAFSSSINLLLEQKVCELEKKLMPESRESKKKTKTKGKGEKKGFLKGSRQHRNQVLSSDMQYRMYLDRGEPIISNQRGTSLNRSTIVETQPCDGQMTPCEAKLGNLYKNKRILSPIKLFQKTKKKKPTQHKQSAQELEKERVAVKTEAEEPRPSKLKSVQFFNPQTSSSSEISKSYYYSSSHISPIAARIIQQSKHKFLHDESVHLVQSFNELPAHLQSSQHFSDYQKALPHQRSLLSATCFNSVAGMGSQDQKESQNIGVEGKSGRTTNALFPALHY